MLTYRQQPPPAHLAPWVECIWTLDGVAETETETILPDGRIELWFATHPGQTAKPNAHIAASPLSHRPHVHQRHSPPPRFRRRLPPHASQ